jgi:hypothetical protein
MLNWEQSPLRIVICCPEFVRFLRPSAPQKSVAPCRSAEAISADGPLPQTTNTPIAATHAATEALEWKRAGGYRNLLQTRQRSASKNAKRSRRSESANASERAQHDNVWWDREAAALLPAERHPAPTENDARENNSGNPRR